MKFQDNFKFLKAELMKRKKTEENKKESEFLVINLLDSENNPCSLFVFNEKLINKILECNFVGLQDVLVTLDVKFSNNKWNVSLYDID